MVKPIITDFSPDYLFPERLEISWKAKHSSLAISIFYHRNIIKYCCRPFASTVEMNSALVERYNSRVSDNDTVYILGDLAFGRDLEPASRLKGRKFLLAGNHDRLPLAAYEAAGLEVIRNGAGLARRFELGEYTLIHSPSEAIRAPRHEFRIGSESQRQLPGETPDPARKYLCGHVHGLFRQYGRFVNVGVDAWDFYPVERREVEAAFANSQPACKNLGE